LLIVRMSTGGLAQQPHPFAIIRMIAIERSPAAQRFPRVCHRLIRPAVDLIGDEKVQFKNLCVDLLLGVHAV
jgi:hypothetical protein